MAIKQEKIFIDGLGLVDGHFSGVGQYIFGILSGIDDILDEMKSNGKATPTIQVIIPFDSTDRFRSFKFKHLRYKRFPLSFRIMSGLWYRNKLPPIDLICGRGVYLFPRFVSMPLIFSKSALVIYDISFELYRQYSDEKNAIFLSNAIKRSLIKTRKVITISDNAKKEIVDFYKLPKNDVIVATPATDPGLFYRRNTEQIAETKRKYGIEGDYILALSNLEPRKNLETLIEAYCKLPATLRETTSLLLVGVSGWKTDKLFEDIINRVQDGYKIIRPSRYVDDKDKPAIISGAKMLVYPSHYEGFGMPPLEALACGTPIITANNSSLPEVVGTAGVMLNSSDIEGFTRAMKTYLTSSQASENAITEGPTRAELFSWKRSAEKVLRVLEELK